MKRCSSCVTYKPKDDFYNNKSSVDGKDYYCKICRTENHMKSYKNADRKDKCTLEVCNRVHYANGYCRLHYERARRNGSPIRLNEKKPEISSRVIANRYKVDINWYLEQIEKGCQICGDKPEYTLHIDHDHTCCKGGSCGKCVRGILCHSCNATMRHYDNGTLRPGNPLRAKLDEYVASYNTKREAA